MAEKKWVVTLASGRPLSDVREALAQAGFAAEQVLEEIGVVTGRADEADVEKIKAIPEVADVSDDAPIDIGPPGAPETW